MAHSEQFLNHLIDEHSYRPIEQDEDVESFTTSTVHCQTEKTKQKDGVTQINEALEIEKVANAVVPKKEPSAIINCNVASQTEITDEGNVVQNRGYKLRFLELREQKC